MMIKAILGVAVACVLTVTGYTFSPTKSACCVPGTACCELALPCCDGEPCCYPGAECCELGLPCCDDGVCCVEGNTCCVKAQLVTAAAK